MLDTARSFVPKGGYSRRGRGFCLEQFLTCLGFSERVFLYDGNQKSQLTVFFFNNKYAGTSNVSPE
jgi:hypothetical protein